MCIIYRAKTTIMQAIRLTLREGGGGSLSSSQARVDSHVPDSDM